MFYLLNGIPRKNLNLKMIYGTFPFPFPFRNFDIHGIFPYIFPFDPKMLNCFFENFSNYFKSIKSNFFLNVFLKIVYSINYGF